MKRDKLPSNLFLWSPTHQRWWSEYMAVFWTVQFALGCALVAVFFNDWSRTLAALGVG